MGQHQRQVAEGLGIVRLGRHRPVGGIDRLGVAAVDELEQGQNRVRAGIVGIELQRLAGRVIGDFSRHRRRPDQIVVVAPDIDRDPRDAGMRVCEIRVQIDRLLIVGQGPAIGLDIAVKEALLLRAQVVVVSFEVVGGDLRQLVAFPFVQLDGQRGNDLADDFVLNREDVGIFAVVTLCPHGKTRKGVDQLDVDPQSRFCALQRAFQDEMHAEFRRHILDVPGLVLEREDRMAGDHEQARHLGQFGDQVVGQAFREMVLLRIAADIDERQHSDRRLVGQRIGEAFDRGRRCPDIHGCHHHSAAPAKPEQQEAAAAAASLRFARRAAGRRRTMGVASAVAFSSSRTR